MPFNFQDFHIIFTHTTLIKHNHYIILFFFSFSSQEQFIVDLVLNFRTFLLGQNTLILIIHRIYLNAYKKLNSSFFLKKNSSTSSEDRPKFIILYTFQGLFDCFSLSYNERKMKNSKNIIAVHIPVYPQCTNSI